MGLMQEKNFVAYFLELNIYIYIAKFQPYCYMEL